MTRGKYANRAATRRAADEVETTISSYQRQVKKLLDENRELVAKLNAQATAHRKEAQVLRAQRDEGIAPMVDVLTAENERLKGRLDTAERDARRIRQKWQTAVGNLFGHFKSAHGLSGDDALTEVMKLLDPGTDPIIAGDAEVAHVKGDIDKLLAIRRARGQAR